MVDVLTVQLHPFPSWSMVKITPYMMETVDACWDIELKWKFNLKQ